MYKAVRGSFRIVRMLYRCALAYWFIRRSVYWFAGEVYYHMLAPLYRQAENGAERRSVLVFVTKWLLFVHRVVPHRLLRFLADDTPIHLHGATFYLGLQSGEAQILREIYDYQLYDRSTDFIPSHGWTVLDVGANAGIYTIQQALRGAHVYAFEPNPHCFRRLSKNVEANNLTHNVHAFDAALGAAPGMGTLIVSPESTPGGVVEAVEATDVATNDVTVRIVSLDQVVSEQGIRHIDLLKIDAEGAEVDILHGAEHTLSIVDRIVLEYHSDALLAQATTFLHEHGFTPVLRIANVMGGNAGILYADKPGNSV